jgi:outer membrane protein assembly factor BamB
VTGSSQVAVPLLGLSLVLLLAPAISAADEPANRSPFDSPVDWPEFGFDSANTSHNPFESIIGQSNVDDLHLLWATPLEATVIGSPALAEGVLYFSAGGNTYSLDAATGAGRWVAGVYGQSLAVANGLVFVNHISEFLYALDAASGNTVWRRSLGGIGSPGGSATVFNDVVYVGSENQFLYAFESNTGERLWRRATGGDIFSSPAVGAGLVYIGAYNGRLYAFDAITGAQVWSKPIGQSLGASPVYADGVVYATNDSGQRLTALEATTGTLLWTINLAGRAATPAFAEGVLYVPDEFRLNAVDASTGSILWRTRLIGGGTNATPVVANGVVYVVTGFAGLVAIDVSNGAILADINLEGGTGSSQIPIVANGTLYVGSGFIRPALLAATP